MYSKSIHSGATLGALLLALVVPGMGCREHRAATSVGPPPPAAKAATRTEQPPASTPVAVLTPSQEPAPSKQPMQPAFNPAEARRMSVEDLRKHVDKGEKVVILDVRGATGGTMAKGAVHVPSNEIETWAKDIAKDTLIVAYCT